MQDFETAITTEYQTEHEIPAIVWGTPSLFTRVCDQLVTTGVVVAFAATVIATLTTMGR